MKRQIFNKNDIKESSYFKIKLTNEAVNQKNLNLEEGFLGVTIIYWNRILKKN